MLNLKIIIGSTRPGRAADRVIPYVEVAFGDDGQPRDHRTAARAKILLDDLAWWGTALQQARSSGVLPPAIMRLAAAEGHRR
jgi:hypothetical protein